NCRQAAASSARMDRIVKRTPEYFKKNDDRVIPASETVEGAAAAEIDPLVPLASDAWACFFCRGGGADAAQSRKCGRDTEHTADDSGSTKRSQGPNSQAKGSSGSMDPFSVREAKFAWECGAWR